MDGLFNMVINFSVYISIPIALRYAILRRPIQSKWTAMCILMPIFIVFASWIGTQREEGQRQIEKQAGIPYNASRPHIIGSPILYMAIVASFFILRRGRNKSEMNAASTTKRSKEKDPAKVALMNKIAEEGYTALANGLMKSQNPYRSPNVEVENLELIDYWDRGYVLAENRKK